MRRAGLLCCCLLLAGCANGGGSSDASMSLLVDNITGQLYSGEPMTLTVIVLSGGRVDADYRGEVTFASPTGNATLPFPYEMRDSDAGSRAFVEQCVFPTEGKHKVNITAAGVPNVVELEFDVFDRPAAPPPEVPNAPLVSNAPKAQIGALQQIMPSVLNNVGVSLAIADFDGDGRNDLMVGTVDSADNLLYITTGTDVFFEVAGRNFAPGKPISDDRMGALVTADLNNNTLPDLVYILENGRIAIMLNEGEGRFGERRLLAAQAEVVVLGDLDGDGDVDLLSGGESVRPWFNKGHGTFQIGNRIEVSASTLVLADFDGDGDLDAAYETGTLLNDGRGYFEPGKQRLCPYITSGLVTSVAAADIDADGDIDLAYGIYGLPNYVYANDGSGTFELVAELGKSCTKDVTFIDLDLDGWVDLLASNHSVPMRGWLNDGEGVFNERQVDSESRGEYTVKGDLDADGDEDIVVVTLLRAVDAYKLQNSGR